MAPEKRGVAHNAQIGALLLVVIVVAGERLQRKWILKSSMSNPVGSSTSSVPDSWVMWYCSGVNFFAKSSRPQDEPQDMLSEGIRQSTLMEDHCEEAVRGEGLI